MKTKKIIQKTLILTVFCLTQTFSLANNVQVTNMSVLDPNNIQFDISWDNSWYNTGTNWDAVWVFVKAQDCSGTSSWDHVNLSTTPANHTVTGGTGLFVEVSTDGKGVFIRRNSNGGGTQSGTITLRFAAAIASFATVNFHIFGIEMVRVPDGDFSVGDGSSSTANSTNSFGTNTAINPRLINSESALAQDALWNNSSGGGSIGAHLAIPAAFPKGSTGFYCMKYELSQQQYVAFLNSLTLAQQGSRTAVTTNSAAGTLAMTAAGNQNRSAIVIQTPSAAGNPAVYNTDLNGNAGYGDGDNIACNFLSWTDLLSYLDWSALRPLTELEFEKAARGVASPITNEYSWSSINITQAISSSLTAGGTSSEVSTVSGNGLCAHNGGASTTLGPLRTGFAATASTFRESAGASYWGIMDLSGNVWEQFVSIGYFNGSARVGGGLIFTGTNGDGAIDPTNGNYNTVNWPSSSVLGHVIVRGGNWEYTAQRSQISDRFYVNSLAENNTRIRRTGGRGGRRP